MLNSNDGKKMEMSVDEVIEEVCRQIEVLILLNFAENYSFVVQDAVQGYHWNNSQATLHPFVAYYLLTIAYSSIKKFCVNCDEMKDFITPVHKIITVILPQIKQILPNLINFSDGAGSQYKNYKNFANLCHHKADLEWMLSGIFLLLVMEKVLVMASVAL